MVSGTIPSPWRGPGCPYIPLYVQSPSSNILHFALKTPNMRFTIPYYARAGVYIGSTLWNPEPKSSLGIPGFRLHTGEFPICSIGRFVQCEGIFHIYTICSQWCLMKYFRTSNILTSALHLLTTNYTITYGLPSGGDILHIRYMSNTSTMGPSWLPTK